MKKLFTKLRRLLPWQHKKRTAFSVRKKSLLAVALVVVAVFPTAIYAWTIYPTMSYDPFYAGQNVTLRWSAPTADYCYVYGPAGGGGPATYINNGLYIYGTTVYGQSGSQSIGPLSNPFTYSLWCYNQSGGIGSSEGSGGTSITVYPTDCSASNFGSPWNSNSYLIYSGGRGTISNWYGRYCLTNYSGSHIYIPMATPTEWNNFVSRASALGVGIVSY
jgi:hypothetical protein